MAARRLCPEDVPVSRTQVQVSATKESCIVVIITDYVNPDLRPPGTPDS
jgi:hypothetical protein